MCYDPSGRRRGIREELARIWDREGKNRTDSVGRKRTASSRVVLGSKITHHYRETAGGLYPRSARALGQLGHVNPLTWKSHKLSDTSPNGNLAISHDTHPPLRNSFSPSWCFRKPPMKVRSSSQVWRLVTESHCTKMRGSTVLPMVFSLQSSTRIGDDGAERSPTTKERSGFTDAWGGTCCFNSDVNRWMNLRMSRKIKLVRHHTNLLQHFV